MAKKKARLYKTRSDGFKYILYPKTDSNCIIMADGETVQDKLSTINTNMFTPVIKASSKTFKVGEGNSVDFSSNAIEGAYNSCVINGRTLVNLASKDIGEAGSGAVKKENTGMSHKMTMTGTGSKVILYPLTQKLTVGRKYLLYAPYNVVSSATTKLHASFSKGISYAIDMRQYGSKSIITPTDGDVENLVIGHHGKLEIGDTLEVNYPILVEYQEGMENWDFPYFEGMCSVKSPILSNCGKNVWSYGDLGEFGVWYQEIKTNQHPAGTYYFSGTPSVASGKGVVVRMANKNLGLEKVGYLNSSTGITTTFDVSEIAIYSNGYSYNDSKDFMIKIDNFMMSKQHGSEYEPYKSNILSCETYFDEISQSDKTIVLRSIPNGKCDTLDVENKKLTQIIEHIVFDGTENWFMNTWNKDDNYCAFEIDSLRSSKMENVWNKNEYVNFYCDTFKVLTNCMWNYMSEKHIRQWSDGTRVSINVIIPKADLTTADVAGFKEYLSANNITIDIERSVPLIHEIDVQGFPYAYKDGYVTLSSDSAEQSLLPSIEYSLISNKAGAIVTNTRMVDKHQKELDELEALLTQLMGTEVNY